MAFRWKYFGALAVTALWAAGISLSAGSVEAAPSTKPTLNVGGKLYYGKTQAESSAVGRWEKQAAIKYGLPFSQWGQAKQKSVLCQFQTHKNNGRKLWSCRAIGRPFAKVKSCRNRQIVAENHRKARKTAVKATRETWEKLAAIKFGVKDSFWKNAENRSTRCLKQGSGAAQEFECRLKATPCH